MAEDRKTVLVTGASGGIGSAMALRFALEGWNVVCHYHSSEDAVKILETKIKSSSDVQFAALKADFSKPEDIEKFADKISSFRIDSIINNAGGYIGAKHFSELTYKDLELTFSLNVFAPIIITSRLFQGMIERNFGRIVNISSVASKYGGSDKSLHYGASKRALEGMSKTFAREGVAHNVLVNSVRLGAIDTEAHKKFPKDMSKRIAMIPMKRMGTVEEIVDLLYYLGSDKNTYIANDTITIAGGE